MSRSTMPITVSQLYIYPVKGLQAIAVPSARCTERGFEHDRRFMVVDAQGKFMSQREHPLMATVWTDIADGMLVLSAPDLTQVEIPLEPQGQASARVQVWNSTCDAVPASRAGDAWLTDYLGIPCRLVYMPESTRRECNPEFAPGKIVSFADGYPYLVTNEASLADLNARIAAKAAPTVPMNRFRPSIVVAGADAYAEDHWPELRMGSAVLRSAKPCGRCQVTTTDQATGERLGPEPLVTLGEYRDGGKFGIMFGQNYATERTGTIRVGDTVTLG
jgi:uncharacterized protein YcbX